jgi:hypothetical protein
MAPKKESTYGRIKLSVAGKADHDTNIRHPSLESAVSTEVADIVVVEGAMRSSSYGL